MSCEGRDCDRGEQSSRLGRAWLSVGGTERGRSLEEDRRCKDRSRKARTTASRSTPATWGFLVFSSPCSSRRKPRRARGLHLAVVRESGALSWCGQKSEISGCLPDAVWQWRKTPMAPFEPRSS